MGIINQIKFSKICTKHICSRTIFSAVQTPKTQFKIIKTTKQRIALKKAIKALLKRVPKCKIAN